MNNAAVIDEVISLFLIILAGIFASKRRIITDEINKGLTELLLKVTLPLLIISSFNFSYSEDMAANVSKAFLYSFIVFVVTAIISYIFLLPVKGRSNKILQFANVFSNCGFMGFSVIDSIYGGEGVVYAAIFNMFFSIFLWTYGVMLFSDKISFKEIKKVLLNPGVVGVYIGLFLMVFHIKLHPILFNSIKTVGSMTTPMSMLIIGVILSKTNLKKAFNDWTIYYGAFLKLFIVPIALYLIALSLGDHSKVTNTLILLQAMPSAAMTSILAESFNKDKEYSAIIVFFTTLLSIGTFPLILKLIM